MPFHSDITMETINDIFPPLDPAMGPDPDVQSLMSVSNGLGNGLGPLSPCSTMADSMLDDSDDLHTLALGDHPFLELTSTIHIKQEYDDDDNNYHDDVDVLNTNTKEDPSSMQAVLQPVSNGVSANNLHHGNGAIGNITASNTLSIPNCNRDINHTLFENSDLQDMLLTVKDEPVEPKVEPLDDEEEEAEDDDEEDDGEDDDDMTVSSSISSTISSAVSSTVSSAAATPVVSPVQSPGPAAPQVNGHAQGRNGSWPPAREKRGNRWNTTVAAGNGKVERKELRKRKPSSYAIMREDPLPYKKKRSYNFRQFRRTIEMSFSSEGEKQEFDESLECLKQWANMKTVTQFLQFAMKQLQELRSQGQSLIIDTPQKARSKRRVKRFQPDQTVSPAQADNLEVFATCIPSIQHLVNQVHDMGTRRLPCPRLTLADRDMHVAVLSWQNGEDTLTWKSSPYLQSTDNYVLNYRLSVGMLTSGMSVQTYERYSKAADFGLVKPSFIEEKCMPGVSAAVGKAVQESTDGAIAEVRISKPSGTEIETHVESSVVSDRRHTTVLALDTDSHKILGSVIITKNDDVTTKSAESNMRDDDIIGSQRLLRSLIEKGIIIKGNTTGSNNNSEKTATANGHPGPDEHMIWKAIREDLKNFSSVTSGLQKDMGRTWHPELTNKEESLRKQLYRSLRWANGDSNQLRRGLCAIPRHYQGSHDLCHVTSPCRQVASYNCAAERITDIKALQMLTVFIQHMNLYRYPTMILEHVKSASQRQPPKVSLRSFCGDGMMTSIPAYNLRTGLFVLWWNENSMVISSQSQLSLQTSPTTCNYAQHVWQRFLEKVS